MDEMKLCEAVFDITHQAAFLAKSELILLPEDSRELFRDIYYMARRFEASYEDNGDYIGDVIRFAVCNLIELYGIKE